MPNQLDLFPEGEIQPAPRFGPEALKERLMPVYTQELLDHPPIQSLAVDVEPSEVARRRKASTYAAKDVSRLLKIIPVAGLELADRGRTATLKALLADWLTATDEDMASGGNGSESVDIDALIQRTREALNV